MGFTTKRLENEPIVIFTYDGLLDQEMFKKVITENVRYIEEIKEPIYIIADVRAMESNFMEMLRIMGEARHEGPGSALDPNIKMLIFAGTNSLVKMYRDAMQYRGTAFGISMFPTLDDAILVARTQVKLDKERKEHEADAPKKDSPEDKSATSV